MHSPGLVRSDAVNSFLVRQQRALGVVQTLAVVDAAEERHLASDAEQRAVLLALVAVETALVPETDAAVQVLTQVQLAGALSLNRTTVIGLHVLKRPQMTPHLCSWAH